MKKGNVILAMCALLFPAIYFQCKRNSTLDARGDAYAGSGKCVKCHSDLYKSYLHTAHFVASIPADFSTVHGSFATNNNVVNFNDSKKVVMEQHGKDFFQTYYDHGKTIESQRFDIVLGGVKGESYLYWKGNQLNQLPISYFTKQDKWMLSPRFDPRSVNFNRAITSRCLECHASYISDQPDGGRQLNAAEQFDRNSLVYGVDCERCHGPGMAHINFQTENPEIKTAKFIASYSSLPRERKLDLCGTCHSGNKSEVLKPTFGFKPGDTLANFKLPGFDRTSNNAPIDVHGNQVQLLRGSKCFIESTMDCATCHNTHKNERGNTVLYTQKCLGCHSAVNHNYCKMANTSNDQFIKSNCIQCHMPALPSVAIISATMNKPASADILVHTHHIAIYPDETKRILTMVAK